MFYKKINYSDITEIEISDKKVNNRVEEIEGGAYNRPYVVVLYKNNKTLRLPLENQNEFLNEIKSKINMQ